MFLVYNMLNDIVWFFNRQVDLNGDSLFIYNTIILAQMENGSI